MVIVSRQKKAHTECLRRPAASASRCHSPLPRSRAPRPWRRVWPPRVRPYRGPYHARRLLPRPRCLPPAGSSTSVPPLAAPAAAARAVAPTRHDWHAPFACSKSQTGASRRQRCPARRCRRRRRLRHTCTTAPPGPPPLRCQTRHRRRPRGRPMPAPAATRARRPHRHTLRRPPQYCFRIRRRRCRCCSPRRRRRWHCGRSHRQCRWRRCCRCSCRQAEPHAAPWRC
mmetsp:Transcript_44893/g.134055  ORF Transcript_44893/g.134055 Transcript_44893/m.134055 type:complete len:227 (+) Transcript_44893:669-1349(+)